MQLPNELITHVWKIDTVYSITIAKLGKLATQPTLLCSCYEPIYIIKCFL